MKAFDCIIKPGDTIECKNRKDAIYITDQLCNLGVNWEFLYKKDGQKGIWILILPDEEERQVKKTMILDTSDILYAIEKTYQCCAEKAKIRYTPGNMMENEELTIEITLEDKSHAPMRKL